MLILMAVSVSTSVQTAVAQTEPQFAREQLTQDFDLFRSILEQANAGLYKYHPQATIDSLFTAQRNSITDSAPLREFYRNIWKLISFTGSSHNSLNYPDSIDKAISKQPIFFPIPVKYVQGKLYTNLAYSGIQIGSEIVRVNGYPAQQFAADAAAFVSTDGHNTTGKFAFLESDWFPFYVYLAYGRQPVFTVQFNTANGLQEITLPAITYKETVANYKNRFIPAYEKKNSSKYSFRYINTKKTACLVVNSFALGGPKSDRHKLFARFLDSVFLDLQKRKTRNLIVDIRQNGGGNDPNDLLLYSYLTQRTFRENKSAHTLFNTVPLKEYFVEEEPGELAELEEELQQEHNRIRNGNYYQNESFNPVWQPNTNAFRGRILLLTDPFVASAGSLFASMIKSDSHTIVIGQETLGGYYGHTGHIPVTYRLPNTGLLLTFSIVDLEQDVLELPDQQKGDGVKPDQWVEPDISDYLNSKDVVMEAALNAIRQLGYR